MKLLITPDDYCTRQDHYTFLVYDINTHDLEYKKEKCEELNCLHLEGQGRVPFRPFGIESDDEHIYIASHDKLAAFNKSTYEFEKLIDVPLYVNTHQILKSGDTFYTCNTAVNSIGIYSNGVEKHLNLLDFSIVDSIPVPKDVNEKDVVHVNSLHEHDGNIYFCLHNRKVKESTFGYFNKETLEVTIIADAGIASHGIAIIGKTLYSLSSGTGQIIEIDLEENKFKGCWNLADPEIIFLRGLDVWGDNLVIGCSNVHDIPPKQENCLIVLFTPKNSVSIPLMSVNEAFTISDLKIVK